MGVNRGGTTTPEFGVGDANAKRFPIFNHISQFQAPDCLYYNAVKAKQPHNSDRVFTTSQKYNVLQVTTSGRKFIQHFY